MYVCAGVFAVVDLYGQCCELSIIPKDQVSVRSTPVIEEGGQEEEEEEWIENGLCLCQRASILLLLSFGHMYCLQ